jgi:hypothetical protein
MIVNGGFQGIAGVGLAQGLLGEFGKGDPVIAHGVGKLRDRHTIVAESPLDAIDIDGGGR